METIKVNIRNGSDLYEYFRVCGKEELFSIKGFDCLFNKLEELKGKDFRVDVDEITSNFFEFNLEKLLFEYQDKYEEAIKKFKKDNQDIFEAYMLENVKDFGPITSYMFIVHNDDGIADVFFDLLGYDYSIIDEKKRIYLVYNKGERL